MAGWLLQKAGWCLEHKAYQPDQVIEMPRATRVKKNAITGRLHGLVLACLGCGGLFGVVTSVASEMKLAPIRLSYNTSGSLDYYLIHGRSDAGYSTHQQIGVNVGAGVGANSFLWYPWLVKVGANVGVNAGLQLQHYAADSLGLAPSDRHYLRSGAAGAYMAVFPSSRFPLMAKFERSDSRSEIGFSKTKSAILIDKLDVNQSYKAKSGWLAAAARFHRMGTQALDGRRTNSEIFGGDINAQLTKYQRLNVDANRARTDDSQTGSTKWDSRLISRHSYIPDSSFSLATLASQTSSIFRMSGEGKVETVQFSSNGVWRPKSIGNLTMTAGVMLNETNVISNGAFTSASSYSGANIGASYQIRTWLRMYGSANAWDSNGKQTVSGASLNNFTYNLSLAAQHRTKPVKLGKYTYGSYVSAVLSNNVSSSVAANSGQGSSTAATAAQSLTMKFRHGLAGKEKLANSVINVSVNQEASTAVNRSAQPGSSHAAGAPVSFVHSATAAWNGYKGTHVRVGVSDRRSTGSNNIHQALNVQGQQVERISGNASMSSNLTINATRQESGDYLHETLTSTASMVYTKNRAFNSPRMRFVSTLRIISANLLKPSHLTGYSNEGQYAWISELKYAVGKLEAEARGRVEEVAASRHAEISLHVRRWF